MSSERQRRAMLTALCGLALMALVAAYIVTRPPSVASLFERARTARVAITSISYRLSAPWPQAEPASSGLPGARALLGACEGERTWQVLWRHDGAMRAELVSPAEIAGVLTVVSPETTWVWSPLLQVALRSTTSTPAPLWMDEVLALAEDGLAGATLPHGGSRDAAIEVQVPLADAAGGGQLSIWFDRSTGLPVRADRVDGGGRLLGTVSANEVRLAAGAGDDDFAFVPPAGARVIDLGVSAALPDLAAAAAASPVPVFQPAYLPAGFTLGAVNVFGRDELGSLVLTYHLPPGETAEAGALLSLTVVRAGDRYSLVPFGVPVKVGDAVGKSFELGELRGLDWRRGEYGFSLFGTIPAAELLRVAASIR